MMRADSLKRGATRALRRARGSTFKVQRFNVRTQCEPYFTWRKTGFARVLVQTGKTRDPQFADTPTIYELMKEAKTAEPARQLLTMILAATDFGRPIIAPPGVAADKTKILRAAFTKAMSDPELLADAKAQNLEITPRSGDDLEALAKQVMASQNPEVIERVKKLLGE